MSRQEGMVQDPLVAWYAKETHEARSDATNSSLARHVGPRRSNARRQRSLRSRSRGSSSPIASRSPVRNRDALSQSSSEEQIESIHAQLSRLEDTLQKIASPRFKESPSDDPLEGLTLSKDSHDSARSTLSRASTAALEEPSYQGESSFKAHSTEAGRILESALNNQRSSFLNGDTSDALKSLKAIFNSPTKSPTLVPYHHDSPICPMTLVLKIIQLIKCKVACYCEASSRVFIADRSLATQEQFTIYIPMIGINDFTAKCQKVYFPIEGYSRADWVIVNGCLMYFMGTLTPAKMVQFEISSEEVPMWMEICKGNTIKTIEQLGLFLEPSLDNIAALLLGVRSILQSTGQATLG